MKKLVLVALTAMVAMAASGCIITSGDDTGDDDGDFATVTAKWSIKNLATNDNTLPCPPGTNTAALYNQAIDDAGDPVGSPAIDLFNCSDFQGAATDLLPDVYQSWVELTNGSGGTVYAKSLSAIVDVVSVDKTFETTILEDGGYFMLDWTLHAAQGAAELSCSQAGANNVSLDLTLQGTGPGTDPIAVDLPCAPGYGVSQGLQEGQYTVSITATDADGPVGPAVNMASKMILDRNQVTDLGHVDVPIN